MLHPHRLLLLLLTTTTTLSHKAPHRHPQPLRHPLLNTPLLPPRLPKATTKLPLPHLTLLPLNNPLHPAYPQCSHNTRIPTEHLSQNLKQAHLTSIKSLSPHACRNTTPHPLLEILSHRAPAQTRLTGQRPKPKQLTLNLSKNGETASPLIMSLKAETLAVPSKSEANFTPSAQ